jgi:citrate lyase subunit beta / citryl-CoA lyase
MTVPGEAPRSLLFVPADRLATYLEHAEAARPDALIVDLQDAVAPDRRAMALEGLAAGLGAGARRQPIFVRINGPSSAWPDDEVRAVAALPSVLGVMAPACEDPDDVIRLVGQWRAVTDRPPSILPLLETARGVLRAREIAAADPAVIGVALGAEDLAADTGLRRTRAGSEILVARSLVVLAAAAPGCWAFDTPCLELRNVPVVERDARRAAALGFDGKLVVHPAQVAPVHRAFRPSREAVAEATRILASVAGSDDPEHARPGVTSVAGRMVDRPVIEAARRVMRQAARGDVAKEPDEPD